MLVMLMALLGVYIFHLFCGLFYLILHALGHSVGKHCSWSHIWSCRSNCQFNFWSCHWSIPEWPSKLLSPWAQRHTWTLIRSWIGSNNWICEWPLFYAFISLGFVDHYFHMVGYVLKHLKIGACSIFYYLAIELIHILFFNLCKLNVDFGLLLLACSISWHNSLGVAVCFCDLSLVFHQWNFCTMFPNTCLKIDCLLKI